MRDRDPIRVIHWGLDPVGLGVARLVSKRPGLLSVGAIETDPTLIGQDLGTLIGYGERLAIHVNDNPVQVLTQGRPDITFITVGARVDEVGPKILAAMEAGSNVICMAEEMVYPWASRPDLAESLDELAHAHGVTVLGTGLNPGFVLDTLVIALTGCCWDVERIRASRVSAIAPTDTAVLQAQGVGLKPGRFMEGLESGAVVGHIGFEQSIHLIADALGWKLDRVEEERAPIIAQVRRETPAGVVEPGQVAGCHHSATGYVDGLPRILLEHPQQMAPEAENTLVGDFLTIEGDPNIRVAIQPEIPGLKGTVGIAVNMIPAVLQVGPGLKTMADLPIPRAVLGDIREMVDMRGPTIEEALSKGWHEPGLGGNPEDEAQGLRTM